MFCWGWDHHRHRDGRGPSEGGGGHQQRTQAEPGGDEDPGWSGRGGGDQSPVPGWDEWDQPFSCRSPRGGGSGPQNARYPKQGGWDHGPVGGVAGRAEEREVGEVLGMHGVGPKRHPGGPQGGFHVGGQRKREVTRSWRRANFAAPVGELGGQVCVPRLARASEAVTGPRRAAWRSTPTLQ